MFEGFRKLEKPPSLPRDAFPTTLYFNPDCTLRRSGKFCTALGNRNNDFPPPPPFSQTCWKKINIHFMCINVHCAEDDNCTSVHPLCGISVSTDFVHFTPDSPERRNILSDDKMFWFCKTGMEKPCK